MDRPFADKRPIGPLAQHMGLDSGLNAIIFYETEIPSSMEGEVLDAVKFHLDSHGVNVSSAEVGPENSNDSVMVTFSDGSFKNENLRSGVSGSVAELKDMGLNPTSNPDVEIII